MTKDGGAAFPRPAGWNGLTSHEDHADNEAECGMSLRDWFAGMALQKLSGEAGWGVIADHSNELASICYKLADAMLAVRTVEPLNT